jgi:hypothetical protein
VSAIVWNAVRDGNGITVRHQWNAHPLPGTPSEPLEGLLEGASEFATRAGEKMRKQGSFAHTSPFRPPPHFSRGVVVLLRKPTADTRTQVAAACCRNSANLRTRLPNPESRGYFAGPRGLIDSPSRTGYGRQLRRSIRAGGNNAPLRRQTIPRSMHSASTYYCIYIGLSAYCLELREGYSTKSVSQPEAQLRTKTQPREAT